MIDAIQVLCVILLLGVTIIIARLLAPYITRVFTRKRTRLDKILNPIENWIFRITGVDPNHSMGWKEYFVAALLLNVAQMILAFLILTFQGKRSEETRLNSSHT